LVNNSYDADANTVRVFVKPDADRIIIEDDGDGMDRKDFERHFSRISETYKRADSETTTLGRSKIGKIGIGFIAANEICDVMEIVSTKLGSTQLLHVRIDFGRMRDDAARRTKPGGDVKKADYEGTIEIADADDHYTHLFLKGVRGTAKNILVAASNRRHDKAPINLYGLKPESVAKLLARSDMVSWSDLDFYSSTMLEIGLNVPVKYHDNWVPARLMPKVERYKESVERLGFSVFYDGADLRKPIILRPPSPPAKALIRLFSWSGDHVGAEGYFYIQHGVLKPQDLNGLLIRIRQAAVGGYDAKFMDFPTSEGTLFQRWISAELWADDRLEDAMNIDRRTLRVSHPAYAELQSQVHIFLSELIREARTLLYESGSRERKAKKAEVMGDQLRQLAREIAPVSRQAATAIVEWAKPDPERAESLLKRYTVTELYRLVLDVANETLSTKDRVRFIQALTKRLTR
jgi:hypothetical protein